MDGHGQSGVAIALMALVLVVVVLMLMTGWVGPADDGGIRIRIGG